MKNTLPTALALLIYVGLGFFAGHYHGKAEVYGRMFEQNAMIAEAINE